MGAKIDLESLFYYNRIECRFIKNQHEIHLTSQSPLMVSARHYSTMEMKTQSDVFRPKAHITATVDTVGGSTCKMKTILTDRLGPEILFALEMKARVN